MNTFAAFSPNDARRIGNTVRRAERAGGPGDNMGGQDRRPLEAYPYGGRFSFGVTFPAVSIIGTNLSTQMDIWPGPIADASSVNTVPKQSVLLPHNGVPYYQVCLHGDSATSLSTIAISSPTASDLPSSAPVSSPYFMWLHTVGMGLNWIDRVIPRVARIGGSGGGTEGDFNEVNAVGTNQNKSVTIFTPTASSVDKWFGGEHGAGSPYADKQVNPYWSATPALNLKVPLGQLYNWGNVDGWNLNNRSYLSVIGPLTFSSDSTEPELLVRSHEAYHYFYPVGGVGPVYDFTATVLRYAKWSDIATWLTSTIGASLGGGGTFITINNLSSTLSNFATNASLASSLSNMMSTITTRMLSDVISTAPTASDFFMWNGAKWDHPAPSTLVKDSVEWSSGFHLVGDSSSPGNYKIYGTNSSGTRTWLDTVEVTS